MKTEEATKLQNGENAKEGATAASVVNVSEEKKKATKQRFMFNIADGGFTGGETRTLLFFLFFLVLSFDLFSLSFQSFTLCGRMKREQPLSPRKPLRFGTVAMTTGCWLALYSIL